MFHVFFAIIATIVLGDLLWWHWADRRLRPLRRAKLWRVLLGAFVFAQVALLVSWVFARWSTTLSQFLLPVPVLALMYVWHLLVLPATVVILLITGGFALTWRTAAWARRQLRAAPVADQPSVSPEIPPPSAPAPVVLTRRQLLGAAAVAVPPLLATGTVGRAMFQLGEFRIRSLELDVPGLPRALDGMTIAHVSDVHAGKFMRDRALRRVADATNRLGADFVCFTGDLIDRALADLPEATDMLRRVDPGDGGLFLCEGNHDLFEGPGLFRAKVKSAGLNLLVNESATVTFRGERIQVLAPSWGQSRRGVDMDLGFAQRSMWREPDAFRILLAHHPHAFDAAAAAGVPLTLAGHTHGGQLMLSEQVGFGPLMYKYWSGAYRHRDSRLVVSNGVGNWFPVRTHAPAEIIHLTLRRT